MENSLKTLYLKQAHDSTGPFQSYTWTDYITPMDMLQQFFGKTYQFETLLYYKCDFIIIPTNQNSPWLQTKISIDGYKKHIDENVRHIIELTKIDYSKYDVVITHDPILHLYIKQLKETYKSTLFCYIMAEHSSWQMHQFGLEYDLWLDHTLNASDDIIRLPQAVNYVFPRVPSLVSSMFNYPKSTVFIDYRSYGHFLFGIMDVKLTTQQITEFNNELDIELPIESISETSLKPYMFVTNSDDSIAYYEKLSRAKYFVTIANRVGQASCDAASMGCLVIGSAESKLHNLICHKDCLMSGEFTHKDVTALIKKLESDNEYYETILKYQTEQLNKWGVEHPQNILKKAWKIKTS